MTGTAETIWEVFASKVVLRVTDPGALDRARVAAEQELNAIDRACSRFRADSEITHLNANAGRAVHVSPLLMEALVLALRAAEITAGDVDPTIGAALVLAGYDRDWRLLDSPGGTPDASSPRPNHASVPPNAPVAPPNRPSAPPNVPVAPPSRPSTPPNAPVAPPNHPSALPNTHVAAPALAAVRVMRGWRRVVLDHERDIVRTPAGALLDLGATAKAWAADRAARAAAEAGACGALVAIGGDIAVSGPAPEGGWLIRVTDDHRSDPRAPGQTVSIGSGGLATSSTSVRRWSHGGRTRHHILDPATGEPAQGIWRTVSAAAASCGDANIATTAAIVRGEQALAWLRALGLPARLVEANGRVHTVGDWPAARFVASPQNESRTASPEQAQLRPAAPAQADSKPSDCRPSRETPSQPPRQALSAPTLARRTSSRWRSRAMAAQTMAAHAIAARASAAQAQEIVR